MKRLEELGISPAPWKVVPYGESTESKQPTVGDVVDATGESLVLDMPTYKDAVIMTAAPKLYSAGYDLLTSLEEWMWLYPPSEWSTMGQAFQLLEEAQNRLRAALAEAAGEEVDDGK